MLVVLQFEHGSFHFWYTNGNSQVDLLPMYSPLQGDPEKAKSQTRPFPWAKKVYIYLPFLKLT